MGKSRNLLESLDSCLLINSKIVGANWVSSTKIENKINTELTASQSVEGSLAGDGLLARKRLNTCSDILIRMIQENGGWEEGNQAEIRGKSWETTAFS
jgi:hypothetical protein